MSIGAHKDMIMDKNITALLPLAAFAVDITDFYSNTVL